MKCSDCGKGEAVRFFYDPRPNPMLNGVDLAIPRFMPAICRPCEQFDKKGLRMEIRGGALVEVGEEEFVRLEAVFQVLDS